jgi:hypothetical protein
MTVLGIEFSDRDQPVTGFETIARSGHCRPAYVADARAEADAAWRRQLEIAELLEDGGYDGIYADLEAATAHAVECERTYNQAWERWQVAEERQELEAEALHRVMLQLAEVML